MKTIIQNVACITILCSILPLNAQPALHRARVKIHLDDEFLKFADGLPGAMDARAFKECFDTRKQILALLHAPIIHEGRTLVALKELVIRELDYLKNNIAQDSSEWIALQYNLSIIKTEFFKVTSQLHEELMHKDMQRTQYIRLIGLFAEKTNRKETLLKNLGKVEERAILEKTSAHDFFIFLHDLKIFLESLMDSTPKARKAYRAYLSPDDQKIFDSFFE